MTTEEMIEVMQHYVNGGEVEYKFEGASEEWDSASDPIWDWDTYDYRIKPEQKKTKPVWFWRIKTANGGFFVDHLHTEEEVKSMWPEALGYTRLDILGSEKVEV